MKKKKKPAGVVALAFEGGKLTALEIRRRDRHCEISQTLRCPLSRDILSGDSELIGAEIRKSFDEAGIREKNCVLSLPLSLVYFFQPEIPGGLSGSDAESYLRLQAEKGLPFPAEDAAISTLSHTGPDGSRRAMIAAVPMQHILTLKKILKSAHLNPLSMTLGITSLFGTDHSQPQILLLAHDEGFDLAIGNRKSIFGIRSFPGTIRMEKEEPVIDAEMIVREMRISLGFLPEDVRRGLKEVRIAGTRRLQEETVRELGTPLKRIGLEITDMATLREGMGQGAAISPHAYAAAVDYLIGPDAVFEFLSPSNGRFAKIAGQISSRRFLWMSGAGTAIVLIAGGAFLVQSLILQRYESKWAAMSARVEKATLIQDNLRKYRPWHDESFPSLSMLKQITESFPEKGDVWVKSLEIRDMTTIQITGEAKNNKVWLEMLGTLRNNPAIKDLKVTQVREDGDVLQFSMMFSM